jgi:fucose permease
MGLLGTLLLIAQQSSLAHHQSTARAVAFTEANIVASLCTMLAPLAVGVAVSSGVGWRVALLLPLPILAILFLRHGREPVPEPIHQQSHAANQHLPRRFWAFWAVACLGVAGEWSVGFWGADYLHTVVGLPLELAVTTLSVFFVAILLGRIAGSRLARQFAPDRLLSGALALGIIGVTLLWQAPNATLSLIGLALSGLGIGNLYPLALAVAVESAPGQISAASVRMTLAGGVAIFSAPLLLGSWADRVGLQSAFALVPIFLILALILTVATTMRSAKI